MKFSKSLLGLLVIAFTIFGGCTTTGKNASNKGIVEKAALVIGNNDYQYMHKLQYAKNDAENVASVLAQFGFNVDLCFDLTYEQMVKKVDQYKEKLAGKNDTEGVFYFAGQGSMLNNKNFLMPVDSNIKNANQSSLNSYALDSLLTKLIEADNAPNMVIIDACFSEIFTEIPVRHRGPFLTTRKDGLELIDQFTKDIFYLQSALPGEEASDDSPFTKALLKHIVKPVRFIDLVQDIITDTLEYSNGQQQPYFKGNTINYGNYILNH